MLVKIFATFTVTVTKQKQPGNRRWNQAEHHKFIRKKQQQQQREEQEEKKDDRSAIETNRSRKLKDTLPHHPILNYRMFHDPTDITSHYISQIIPDITLSSQITLSLIGILESLLGFMLFMLPLSRFMFSPIRHYSLSFIRINCSGIRNYLSISTGYFLWDIIVSLKLTISRGGIGFLVHAISCFVAFLYSIKPFGAYFGFAFLLWEASTIFLNPHWFFDKIGMSGSKAQLYNGVALLLVFFFSRLVLGNYTSYQLFALSFEDGVSQKAGSRLLNTIRV
ncbi:hypothetical protein PSHT_11454 [Puccinia striiformis]|uniref:TLC domain-containing protein n=1 Tax=Puccinia striiformis TaxID=27350 RepID=A0A2S4V376_9BASI|nr:hypothetical protein PSHT_11454 [Puccinia striiformis]